MLKSICARMGKTEEEVKAWLESPARPNLAIMTPCYDGQITVAYHVSLTNTMDLMRQLGILTKTLFIPGDSLVHRSRNNLLAMAMADPAVTHFMFIDADIQWSPMDVLQLMLRDKDFVGGIYPKKAIPFSKLVEPGAVDTILKNKSPHLQHAPNDAYLQAALLDYNLNLYPGETNCANLIAKVHEIATGFMMFRRGVVEKMIAQFPHTKYRCNIGLLSEEQNKFAYCLFDSAVQDGILVSEDYLFCRRWAAIGGEVFADLSIALTHIGRHSFTGAVVAKLNLIASRAPALDAVRPFSAEDDNRKMEPISKRRRVFEMDEMDEMDEVN